MNKLIKTSCLIGRLEETILAVILTREEEKMDAKTISSLVEEHLPKMSAGAFYTTVHRMAKSGLLLEERLDAGFKQPKFLFSVTPQGKEAAQDARLFSEHLWNTHG